MAAWAEQSQQITDLARSHAPEDRGRLLDAMVDLCEAAPADQSPASRDLMQSIFMDLVGRAERDIRLRLAERIAPAAWAPSALVNMLATDDIEIARPVIAKSPVLQDRDLIRLMVTGAIEHQIEIARRPGIGAPVVNAILDCAEPPVLTTLAGNPTAEISPLAMERLVAASKTVAAMRAPLARHPKLTQPLGCLLYSWVGEALRREIASRFPVDDAALKAAMEGAVADCGSPGGDHASPPPEAEREPSDERLVAKLQAAGQLRPGFLLRSLREGKLGLFEIALACLAGVRTEEVRSAIRAHRPELLAAVCASVGIDRSVFPTVLALVRALCDGAPKGDAGSLRGINAAFTAAVEGKAVEMFKRETADLPAV